MKYLPSFLVVFVLSLVLGIAAPISVEAGINTKLIGHWKLDEGFGLIIRDSGPTGYPAGRSFSDDGEGSFWLPGKVGPYALEFQSANGEYADLGTIEQLWLEQHASMSAWVKSIGGDVAVGPAQFGLINGAFSFNWDVDSDGVWLYIGGSNMPGAYYAPEFHKNSSGFFSVPPDDGNWHHMVLTFNGESSTERVVAYWDGVRTVVGMDAPAYLSNPDELAGLKLGYAPFYQLSDGIIDDVRIWERTLSQSEIPDINDTTPPTVTLLTPTEGENVSGVYTVVAQADDAEDRLIGVTFKIDGQTIVTDTTAPYQFDWNTTIYTVGSKVVTAIAQDGAGNVAQDDVNATVVRAAPGGITSGLVGWYKFNSDAQDYSGQNNHGNLLNGGSYVSGRIGSGALQYEFGGKTSNYVDVSDNNSLDLNKFSIGGWININSYNTNWTPILVKEDMSGVNRNYGLYLMPGSGQIHYSFQDASCSSFQNGNSNGSVPLNSWKHVFMTYDGANSKLYMNGALDSSTAFTAVPCQSGANVHIGEPFSGAWQESFTGKMDDMRIYNRALTASEVALLFNYDEPGGTTGDTQAPSVATPSVTPISGNTVAGNVTISTAASDNVGVSKVEFYVDGILLGLGTSNGSGVYSIGWNTNNEADATHSLTAKAFDAAGNTRTSPGRSVVVANAGASVGTPVGTGNAQLKGWAWSDNFGWISFNSTDSGAGSSVPYAVTVDTTSGEMAGMAWSENLGWISFYQGDALTGARCGPLGGPANVNRASGAVTGFAYAMTYGTSPDGCIAMSGANHSSPDLGGTGGVTINPTTGEFLGFAWGGDATDSVQKGTGWIQFNASGAKRDCPGGACSGIESPPDVACPDCAGGSGNLTASCTTPTTNFVYQPGGHSITWTATVSGGTAPFIYSWLGGTNTYTNTYTSSDFGPSLTITDSAAPVNTFTAACPAINIVGSPGSNYIFIGKTVATANDTNYVVRQGGPFALRWDVQLPDVYDCDASITPINGYPASWTNNWNDSALNENTSGSVKRWDGNTGTSLNAAGVTPGIYTFAAVCTNSDNGDKQTYSSVLKVNRASEIEI